MSIVNRQDFLKIAGKGFLAISGILGFGMLVRFLGYRSEEEAQTVFDLGLASDFPVGSRTHLPDIPAVLIHNETGFAALSLVCTHLGCTLEQDNDEFRCPCHGSQFDGNGVVLQGPAAKGLTQLTVEQDDQGHIILFRAS
ncbi:ubiquinol-cytochrome c reductase iron-sulfur subunit [Chloroflexota bacterium]